MKTNSLPKAEINQRSGMRAACPMAGAAGSRYSAALRFLRRELICSNVDKSVSQVSTPGVVRAAGAAPEISLFGDKNPCSGAINSLFCILQGIYCKVLILLSISASAALKGDQNDRKLSKFPVKFPVLREIAAMMSAGRGHPDRASPAFGLSRGCCARLVEAEMPYQTLIK